MGDAELVAAADFEALQPAEGHFSSSRSSRRRRRKVEKGLGFRV